MAELFFNTLTLDGGFGAELGDAPDDTTVDIDCCVVLKELESLVVMANAVEVDGAGKVVGIDGGF